MKKYSINKIDKAKIKYFTIQLGLLAGYDNTLSNEHTIDDVLYASKKWIENRVKNDLPVFGLAISPSYFVYGFKNEAEIICNSENSVSIQGEIMERYCSEIFNNNQKLLNIIIDIASYLGTILEQERVHIIFENEKIILE